ncbi:MAG TPA: hypothetical protein VKS43_08715 [Burkholderiales bacterium]|nr:hypothetical protein [Burkholderiales bacterium]
MNQVTALQLPYRPRFRLMAFRTITFALLCAGTGLAFADDIEVSAALRARYLAMQEQLVHNQFGRPLHLDSSEAPGEVSGDIYALINSPFESAGAALSAPGDWCDMLLLHIDTKGCRVASGSAETVLSLWIGAKHDQPLSDASRVNFSYHVHGHTENYLRVDLDAKNGPMSTRDYRIALEAVSLPNGQTFIHLAFSYGYGSLGRFVMQAYLATLGRSKVGFTVVGAQPDGRPRYIGGVRGAVERNTMRYYLAIEAYLGALSMSSPSRFEIRIRDWYAASELYSRQLHEVERGEYLDMKRKEHARQQAGPA